jgi:hypothetical protein
MRWSSPETGESGAMAFHEADGGGEGGISNSGRLRRKRGRRKEGGGGVRQRGHHTALFGCGAWP